LSDSLDQEIHTLRAAFWSARDPEGRGFASLADAYRRRGNLDEAHLLVQEGLGRHPDFATGHLVASRVARERGDLVAAREHLDRVLQLDGGNVLAVVERAGALASEGDREGASEDLQVALDQDPSDAEALGHMEALETESRFDTELEPADEQESGEEGPILTRTMGDLFARQGFRERALEVYEQLLEKNPEDQELIERLEELRASPGAERPPEVAEAIPEEAGRDAQSIASYLEDLLAWVPDAVPIESLAPSAQESAAEPMSAEPTGGQTADEAASEAAPDPKKDDSEEGLDDFNRWLRSLQS
jgi:tetratricopeptide (TPR) repeat protein